MRPIRVTLLDPSALAGQLLARILQEDGRFRVVGVHAHPRECLESLKAQPPDVVVADLGDDAGDAEFVRAVSRGGLGPILIGLLMVEAASPERVSRLKAAGMYNHIVRPAGVFEFERIGLQIRMNILAACMIRRIQNPSPGLADPPPPPEPARRSAAEAVEIRSAVLFFGGRGSRASFEKLLPVVGKGPARLIVALLHDQPALGPRDAERWERMAGIPVRLVQDRAPLVLGQIHVCFETGSDLQVLVDPASRAVSLAFVDPGAPGDNTPSFDRLAEDVARLLARNLTGIALSGSVPHGIAGFRAIQQAGGTVLAEDPAIAQVPALAREVARLGLAREQVSPDRLAELFALAPNSRRPAWAGAPVGSKGGSS